MTVTTRHDKTFQYDLEPENTAAARPSGRFRKGQSGNPKGRPPSIKIPEAKNFGSAMTLLLSDMVIVTIGGKQTQVPRYTAIAMKMVNELASGSMGDRIKILAYLDKQGIIDHAKDISQLKEDLQEANSTAAVWTPELEAKYQLCLDESGEYINDFENDYTGICSECGKEGKQS